MLLPKGLDGILVAGKAVSATHDALPAIRMQSDLENLGAVCALAAVQAVGCCRSPREIDIKLLQQRLGKEGLIPEDAVTRKLSLTGTRMKNCPNSWTPSKVKCRSMNIRICE